LSDEDLVGRPSARPLDWRDTKGGVTADWLAQAFRMDRRTLNRRLHDCPFIPGTDKYDLSEAASYLVKPRHSIEEFARYMKKSDLPPELREAYWAAMLKQTKWMQEARELWNTQDVFEVLGEAFKRLKNAILLAQVEIDEAEPLTVKQRAKLRELLDGLQRDLHTNLLVMAQERKTPSYAETADV
jgi:hypothetical protein